MFRYKDYIFTICETGSFTRAAEKLFVSQPSLSATVKRLEERIGEPIFDRSGTPVSLTEVGKEYVKCAMQIREIERDFEKYVFDYGNLLTGEIRIGGSSFFSSLVLPEIISEFSKENSKIEFEIFEDNTKNLLAKLRENSLDIIVDNTLPDEENILSKVYRSERLLLAVPKKFAINEQFERVRLTAEQIKRDEHLKAKGIDFSKLKGQPFVLLRKENDTGRRAEKLFKKYDVEPNTVFYLDQQVTSYNVACAGIGIVFVSDTLVKRIGASPDVYYYKINDRLAVRDIYFLYRKNGYLSSACRKFIAFYAKIEQ
jgi:DNA-binding transcriptional LysR family regulator